MPASLRRRREKKEKEGEIRSSRRREEGVVGEGDMSKEREGT